MSMPLMGAGLSSTVAPAPAAATGRGLASGQGTKNTFFNIGDANYLITDDDPPDAGSIYRGASAEEYAANIAERVNLDTAITRCTCVAVGASLTFTANTPGAAGNSIPLSTDDANLTLTPFIGGTG